MKMHVHREAGAAGPPFLLSQVKEHVRVDGSENESELETKAQTAAAEIENFAQIALLTQTIRVTIFDPHRTSNWLSLPIGPADENNVPTVTVDGSTFTDFDFVGGNRPGIRFGLSWFDLISPTRVNIEYQAGFGDTAGDIPHDLAQAIMDQTGLHFDGRSPMDGRSLTSSPHMARIGARYRGVQV